MYYYVLHWYILYAHASVEPVFDLGKKGNLRDGKIFILPVEEVICAWTGERGKGAV